MNEYKQHLRRLAVHDEALLDAIATDGGSFATTAIDERTVALVRVAATIAVDAAPSVVPARRGARPRSGSDKSRDRCQPRGADADDGHGAIVPVYPEVALALGYDVEAALEQLDS